jgi:hypothetical protein
MVLRYSIYKRLLMLLSVTLMAQSYCVTAQAQQSPQSPSVAPPAPSPVPPEAATSAPPSPWLQPNRTGDPTQQSILPPILVPGAPPHAVTAEAPAPAAAPAAPSPTMVAVHFDANLDDVRLLLRRDEGVYARAPQYDYLCAAPCDLHFFPGSKRMSVSLQGETPIDIADPITLPDNSVLRATYSSRAFTRQVGLGVLIGGAVFGSLVGCVGIAILPQNQATGISMISGGGAVALGSVVVGSILMLKGDRAKIEIVPQTLVAPPADRALSSGYRTGTAIKVTF